MGHCELYMDFTELYNMGCAHLYYTNYMGQGYTCTTNVFVDPFFLLLEFLL